MAITDNFYLNGPTLSSSTAIFTDAAMTTCADDGYYSDGIISREQVGCVLLPEQKCTQCGFDCGDSYNTEANQVLDSLNIDTTNSLGAIIIRFTTVDIPVGIKAVFNGISYNKLSSPDSGYIQGSIPNEPTYLGRDGFECSILNTGGDISLEKRFFDGTNFTTDGTSENVHIDTAQVYLGLGSMTNCVMVIPKNTNVENVVNLYFYAPCGASEYVCEILCPELLPDFDSTVVQLTEPTSAICSVPLNRTYYFAKVHAETDSFVGLYDLVFSDPYGANALPDGWYRIDNLDYPNDTIRVENGIVVDLYDNC